jgi:hypothetical protein
LKRQQRAKERFLRAAVAARPPAAVPCDRPSGVTSIARSPTRWRAFCDAQAAGPRPGDRLAVVAPASPFNRDEFDRGSRRFAGWDSSRSTTTRCSRAAVSCRSARASRAAIRAAWRDPSIAGLIGGSRRLRQRAVLPLLDRDEARARRKPFIGYSDLTSILTFLTLGCELVAFHGPMLDGAGRAAPRVRQRFVHARSAAASRWGNWRRRARIDSRRRGAGPCLAAR